MHSSNGEPNRKFKCAPRPYMHNFSNPPKLISCLEHGAGIESLVYRYQVHDIFSNQKRMPQPLRVNRVWRVADNPIHRRNPIKKVPAFLQLAIIRSGHLSQEHTVTLARVKHPSAWCEVPHHRAGDALRCEYHVLMVMAKFPCWLKLQAPLHVCSNPAVKRDRPKAAYPLLLR